MNARAELRKLAPLLAWVPAALGIVSFVISYLSKPEAYDRPWVVLTAVATVVCFALIPRLTLPAWAAYLVLYLYIMWRPEFSSSVHVLMALIPGAIVAYRGYTVSAVLGGIVIIVVGTINPIDGVYLPDDWLAFAVWAAFTALPISVGHSLYRSGWQLQELRTEWESDLKSRRETMGRILHDSVASSLTSLIMRLEAMSLQHDLPQRTQDELVELADEAQLSMQEVRELLRTLSTDDKPRSTESYPSVRAQLRNASGLLIQHGFSIKTTGRLADIRLNADQLSVLQEVFKELAINIVKYAQPDSTIALHFSKTQGFVHIAVTNRIKHEKSQSMFSSDMGLPALSQMMEIVGGNMSIVSSLNEWTTELEIPHKAADCPR